MREVPVAFCGQTYTERSRAANAQDCVNLFPVRSPAPGDPDRLVLYPTPGYSQFLDTRSFGVAGAGEIRGMYVINGVLFVVTGTKFVRVNAGGTLTELGTLSTSAGRCSIACNTVELVISDGAFGYTYNLSSGSFAGISGGGWPAEGVTNLTYMDGYVLAARNNSKRVIQSNLLSGGVYGAQAFADVTSFPDNLRAAFSDQLQLYVFGPRLTEVRNNSGAVPFAFEKVPGVLIQAGCVSWATLLRVGGSVVWLASDENGKAYVAALAGYNTRVLSTPAVNEALERYETVSDAFAYSYREADSQFYCLTFPSAGATWCYDLRLNLWHRRQAPAGGPDYPLHCVEYFGRQLVGGADGRLLFMSQDHPLAADGGYPRRVRTSQHLEAGGTTLFLHELWVDVQAGVGRPPPQQGDDPLATLEVSADGGSTWRSAGTASVGKMGEYRRRLTWRRLGHTRTRFTFRLTVTDPVGVAVLGARARVTAGAK